MKSPCRAACKNNGGICSGCHRTMEEIVQWKDKSDAQRDAIIEQLVGNDSTTLALNVARTRTAILLRGKRRAGALILRPEIYQSQKRDSFVCVVNVWRKSQSPSLSNIGHNGLAIIEMKVSSANYFCANAWVSNFTPSQPVTIKLRMF